MKKFFSIFLVAVLALLTAAPLPAQEKTLKRKVAIGRFTNETQYGKGLFYDKENDPMRKQALDILSAKLAQSGKFILLEREDLDVLVSEAGEDMKKIGADYINGDTYYKIRYPDHNMVRSRAQWKLYQAACAKLDEMALSL